MVSSAFLVLVCTVNPSDFVLHGVFYGPRHLARCQRLGGTLRDVCVPLNPDTFRALHPAPPTPHCQQQGDDNGHDDAGGEDHSQDVHGLRLDRRPANHCTNVKTAL
jgi:hypothetical protein